MLLQAEVRLAREQACDAASVQQQTEAARLQLEGLYGQALQASAELLQQNAALGAEKQRLQDSCASLEDELSVKEVSVLHTRTNQETVLSMLGRPEVSTCCLRQSAALL